VADRVVYLAKVGIAAAAVMQYIGPSIRSEFGAIRNGDRLRIAGENSKIVSFPEVGWWPAIEKVVVTKREERVAMGSREE